MKASVGSNREEVVEKVLRLLPDDLKDWSAFAGSHVNSFVGSFSRQDLKLGPFVSVHLPKLRFPLVQPQKGLEHFWKLLSGKQHIQKEFASSAAILELGCFSLGTVKCYIIVWIGKESNPILKGRPHPVWSTQVSQANRYYIWQYLFKNKSHLHLQTLFCQLTVVCVCVCFICLQSSWPLGHCVPEEAGNRVGDGSEKRTYSCTSMPSWSSLCFGLPDLRKTDVINVSFSRRSCDFFFLSHTIRESISYVRNQFNWISFKFH